MYSKPISKFLYIHASTNHPRHVLTGVVKGELIRFLRSTNNRENWAKKCSLLFKRLRNRGYSNSILRELAATGHANGTAATNFLNTVAPQIDKFCAEHLKEFKKIETRLANRRSILAEIETCKQVSKPLRGLSQMGSPQDSTFRHDDGWIGLLHV